MTYYGIYKITNLIDGKMYIGKHQTDDLDDGYMGSGKYLKRAIKKYGVENFRKEWLGFYETEEEMNYMEKALVDQTWIDRADTYNLALGGEGGTLNNLGRKHNSIVRKNMSEAAKKRIQKYGHPMFGRKRKPLSDDSRKRISDRLKGRKNPNAIKAMNDVRRRRIGQYDSDMKLIKSFDSISSAQKETGYSHGNICQCCRLNSKVKTVGGFIWRYI